MPWRVVAKSFPTGPPFRERLIKAGRKTQSRLASSTEDPQSAGVDDIAIGSKLEVPAA